MTVAKDTPSPPLHCLRKPLRLDLGQGRLAGMRKGFGGACVRGDLHWCLNEGSCVCYLLLCLSVQQG